MDLEVQEKINIMKDGVLVIDNLLNDNQIKFLENSILGVENEDIKWNFRNFIVGVNKHEIDNEDSYQFTNSIFHKSRILNENFFNNFIPMFEQRLKVEHWLKIKMNFRPVGKKIETEFHTDLFHEGFMFLTAVFYLNDNNGCTEIVNKKSEKILVESKRNRCVIFRGDLLHRAVTSNDKHRIVLNMNFLNSEVIDFYNS